MVHRALAYLMDLDWDTHRIDCDRAKVLNLGELIPAQVPGDQVHEVSRLRQFAFHSLEQHPDKLGFRVAHQVLRCRGDFHHDSFSES